MFLSLNTKIKHFLFQKTRYYESNVGEKNVTRKEKLSSYKNQLVIPRRETIYKTLSVEKLKKSDIDAFVANQAVSLSPFASCGFYVSVNGGVAMLWIWDSEYELSMLEKLELSHEDTLVIPETVLYPASENLALVACISGGFEGQIWRGNSLIASRYWPKEPSHNQIRTFSKAFVQEPESKQEFTSPKMFEPSPWNEHEWSFLLQKPFLAKMVPLMAAALWLIAFGWVVARYGLLWGSYLYFEQKYLVQQEAVEDTLNNRQETLKLNQQNRALGQIATPPQLSLLYDFVNSLTTEVSDVLSWSFEASQIRIEIQVSNADTLDVSALVKNLEQLSYVESVSSRKLGTVGNKWEVIAEVDL
jgi:hypothetical protein